MNEIKIKTREELIQQEASINERMDIIDSFRIEHIDISKALIDDFEKMITDGEKSLTNLFAISTKNIQLSVHTAGALDIALDMLKQCSDIINFGHAVNNENNALLEEFVNRVQALERKNETPTDS